MLGKLVTYAFDLSDTRYVNLCTGRTSSTSLLPVGPDAIGLPTNWWTDGHVETASFWVDICLGVWADSRTTRYGMMSRRRAV